MRLGWVDGSTNLSRIRRQRPTLLIAKRFRRQPEAQQKEEYINPDPVALTSVWLTKNGLCQARTTVKRNLNYLFVCLSSENSLEYKS